MNAFLDVQFASVIRASTNQSSKAGKTVALTCRYGSSTRSNRSRERARAIIRRAGVCATRNSRRVTTCHCGGATRKRGYVVHGAVQSQSMIPRPRRVERCSIRDGGRGCMHPRHVKGGPGEVRGRDSRWCFWCSVVGQSRRRHGEVERCRNRVCV